MGDGLGWLEDPNSLDFINALKQEEHYSSECLGQLGRIRRALLDEFSVREFRAASTPQPKGSHYYYPRVESTGGFQICRVPCGFYREEALLGEVPSSAEVGEEGAEYR